MENCSLSKGSAGECSTMHYVSAAHGGWGIVRIAALVPESYLLFVCPFACGRHTALGGKECGIKDRVSYLFITEADIVSGDFEQMIIDSIGELFEALKKKPRVLFIFTSCLDDLLGTDHDAINAELSGMYPEVLFRHCKMNPISLDSSLPPGITLNMNIYSLLEKTEKKEKVVNILGCNVTLPETGDLKELLRQKGYRLCNVSDCKNFDEFSHMSDACLNIVAGPIALKAAQEMEERLDIPYIKGFVTYEPKEIGRFYRELSEALGMDFETPSFIYREKALDSVKKLRERIGEYPVAIDYQAVLKPYSLGCMLTENGIRVGMIASDTVAGHERENYEKLLKTSPQTLMANPVRYDAVGFPYEGGQYLCIGFDCGYMTRSGKVVNLMQDEGLFGYDGICRLMEMMGEAYVRDADVKTMIKEAKLII